MEQAKQAVNSLADGVKKVAIGNEGKGKKASKETAATDVPTLSELNPPPAFIDERLAMFEKLKKQQDENIAKQPRDPILITMPDGSVRPGVAWETTPKEIAEGISKSLYKRACIAKVRAEGEPTLWDLDRPLESSCKLEILDFSHPEGRQVFWHSVGTGTRGERICNHRLT